MKLCIATNEVGKPSERFVENHIKNLFGGQTCVIHRSGHTHLAPSFKISYQFETELPTFANKLFTFYKWKRYKVSDIPTYAEQQKIRDFLKQEHVSAVLAEFGPIGCLMYPIVTMIDLPIYTYFRGYDATLLLNNSRVRGTYRRLIPKMDGIFAVSPHLLENLKAAGVQWKQAHVIPSGVNTNAFKPEKNKSKNPLELISVGRFVEKKSPLLTIRAFSKLLSINPDIHMTMIGDGRLFTEAKEISVKLQISQKITFMGAQPHHVIRDKLSKASIFLLHSVTTEDGNMEGFPSAVQEAMASGVAIVSTRHGGIINFIEHERNGLLVDEHDLEGYVEQVQRLILDEELRSELAGNARRDAVNFFDRDKLYRKLESIICS